MEQNASMPIIELTDAQRQALQAEPGRPVDVLDPATQQRYVLLAREQYEQVRALLEGGPRSAPSADACLRTFVEALMVAIELTDAQRQALQAEPGKPVEVLDPATQQHHVFLAREQFEKVRALLEGGQEPSPPAAAPGISPERLRSQQAYWRDVRTVTAG
jgi:hypothetical protein